METTLQLNLPHIPSYAGWHCVLGVPYKWHESAPGRGLLLSKGRVVLVPVPVLVLVIDHAAAPQLHPSTSWTRHIDLESCNPPLLD